MADPEQKVDPAQVDPGLPFSQDYSILVIPDLGTVTSGAQMRYVCLYKLGSNYPMAWDNTGTHLLERYSWYILPEAAIIKSGDAKPVTTGPVGYTWWNYEWDQPEGKYVVALGIKGSANTEYAFVGQRVTTLDAALSRLWYRARKFAPAHPDEALGHVNEFLRALKTAEEKVPITDPEKKKLFDGYRKQQENYRDQLGSALKSTEGLVRYPIQAVHFSEATQQELVLNVFVAKLKSSSTGNQVWRLVDWTDPTRPEICQTFDESGETDKEALKSLFKSWDRYHNRYPKGRLHYDLKIGSGFWLLDDFETNGATAWDFVSELLGAVATAGLVVAGVVTLIAPVPGSRVISAAIWASILSSTAAAAINIYQRYDQGYGTWEDNAIDGLTIVGNMLAGIGMGARVVQAARMAEGAAWARGATVEYAGASGKILKYTLIGQVGNDMIQGVLVAHEEMQEYDRIMNDKSLMPDERVDRLLTWLRRLATVGLMTYISVRSSASDLEALNQQTRYIGDGKKVGAVPDDVKPPKEKLDNLADPNQTVDLQTKVPTEGEVPKDKGKNQTTHQKTKAELIGAAAQQKGAKPQQMTFQERFPNDDKFWKYHVVDDPQHIDLEHAEPLDPKNSGSDYVFRADCEDGIMHVDIIRTYNIVDNTTNQVLDSLQGGRVKALRKLEAGKAHEVKSSYPNGKPALMAKELYPMMYEHFAKYQEIKGAWGEFAWDNRQAYRAGIKNGLTPHQAIRQAKSFKYWEDMANAHGLEIKLGSVFENSSNLIEWHLEFVPKKK